jgi:uncharacterized protein (DUF2225 family)
MDIKYTIFYTKALQNILFSIPRPSKKKQMGIFGVQICKTSGNPDTEDNICVLYLAVIVTFLLGSNPIIASDNASAAKANKTKNSLARLKN